jgi:hypothetical protein
MVEDEIEKDNNEEPKGGNSLIRKEIKMSQRKKPILYKI